MALTRYLRKVLPVLVICALILGSLAPLSPVADTDGHISVNIPYISGHATTYNLRYTGTAVKAYAQAYLCNYSTTQSVTYSYRLRVTINELDRKGNIAAILRHDTEEDTGTLAPTDDGYNAIAPYDYLSVSAQGLEVARDYGMKSYSRIIATGRVRLPNRKNPTRSEQWFAEESGTFTAR